MGHKVKIKIRAGQKVQFPAQCIHCNNPASERLRLHKRIGRLTRKIDAPLCRECAHQVQRLSGEEERWRRLGWLLSSVAWLTSFSILLLLLPAALGLPLRFFVSGAIAFAAAAATFRYSRAMASRRALPQKQAILRAANLVDFSWRAATFEFVNKAFAERFSTINESRLFNIQ